MFKFIITTFFLVFITGSSLNAQLSGYLWPTDASTALSSTFGETRSAHFHSGLDIKTWGREGYRVFASKDGIVSKLSITASGYGNAVYLKHYDGSYTVYAHLQRFNNSLQALIDSVRLQDYSFEIELNLENDNIEIKQGAVIGFTGSTGVGPPHLHFEVRDSLNRPINPLRTNLNIRDNIPPTFSSILIEPQTLGSRINGKAESVEIRPLLRNENYTDFGTITFNGEIGLAVNVFDKADNVTNAYAVYELMLIQEVDTLFYQRKDDLDFEYSDVMFEDRVSGPKTTRRTFQRLFKKPNLNHPFMVLNNYPTFKSSSFDSIEVFIHALDYFGNESRARVQLIKSTPQNIEFGSLRNRKNIYWHEDWAVINNNSFVDLLNMNEGVIWSKKINQTLLYPFSNPALSITRIQRGRNYTINSYDYRLKTIIPQNSFFNEISLIQSYQIINDSISIQLEPNKFVSRKNIDFEFYLGDDFSSVNPGFYTYNSQRKEYSYISSKLEGNTLKGSTKSLDTFYVLSDSEAPTVSNLRIQKNDWGMWVAVARISDNLSGFDYRTAIFKVNSKRGIAVFDDEDDTLTYYLPGFSPKSENEIEIEIKDRAGNLNVLKTLLKN